MTDDLLETLAAIEHEQWMMWAKTMLESEHISDERAARWMACMKPYNELTEEQKEQDRVYARKVLPAVEKFRELLNAVINTEWVTEGGGKANLCPIIRSQIERVLKQ